jgi:hypothetical protein
MQVIQQGWRLVYEHAVSDQANLHQRTEILRMSKIFASCIGSMLAPAMGNLEWRWNDPKKALTKLLEWKCKDGWYRRRETNNYARSLQPWCTVGSI